MGSGGDVVNLKVNGKDYQIVGESVDARLVNFLQDNGSSGTHVTCYEGGCGACTVVASVPVTGSATGERTSFSINSCLASLYGCDGWEITTIEGLGNRFDGYHMLQERLAEYNGTQCGYCSPGFVMNMYGLTQSNPSWTPSDVERNLDGNLCRCTGYRPILDAFKSVTPQDIEDIGKNIKPCAKGRTCCQMDKSKVMMRKIKKEIVVDGVTWYQPTSLSELNGILSGLSGGTNYRLVCGNTGNALYDDGPYSAFINTRMVPELYSKTISENSATFGVNKSLAEMIRELKSLSGSGVSNFSYLAQIAKHWEVVANASVRNLGSLAGNLGIRTMHHEFPSDIFVTLLAAGALVNISADSGASIGFTDLQSMLAIDFVQSKSVLLQIRLLPLPVNTVYRSFKIMPRSANSRAYVSAAFNVQIDTTTGHTVTGTPVLAFTGISSTFIRATSTEAYLVGKNLDDIAVLQGALSVLATEIIPDATYAEPSPQYKLSIAQHLLYKYVLGIVGNNVAPEYISGSTDLLRPLSSGTQLYDQNETIWPLGQPIPKLEAQIQCSGEAEYVKTMAPVEGELVGIFVQSTVANAKILSINADNALTKPGVVGFISAKDIKGLNNIIVFTDRDYTEELFPSDRVSYYGQPLGLIVATSRGAAYSGVYSVQVEYEDEQPPILTIQDALAQGSIDTIPGREFIVGDVNQGFLESDQTISGAMSRDGQFHFHMETQSCLTVPTEDGLDVYSTTQWLSETQFSIAQVLGVPDNSINMTLRRTGGAFGAKIDRCNIIATATALAAHTLRKPVRVSLDLGTNMTLIGWRDPFLCTYKVGVTNDGLLKAVEATLTGDTGYVPIGSAAYGAAWCMTSCYACPNWKVSPQVVITNTASNTWCRTPSTVEGITFMENILEHVAVVLGKDPLDLRRLNLLQDGSVRKTTIVNPKQKAAIRAMGPHGAHLLRAQEVLITKNLISDMIDQIIASSDYEARKAEITTFNQTNRWRKRGIAIMPMLWPYSIPAVYGFGVVISIYAHDGTVAIAHGGVEVGQGINTKCAQAAAYILGCDLSNVKIKPTDNLSGANSNCTGGSCGSDANLYIVKVAAERLQARLAAVNKPTWLGRVKEAYNQGIDLSERYWNGKGEVKQYSVFGVACTEVELDVLTGNFIVTRADILEDAGTSPSPLLDVGQVEGAFVFGQGLFTTEKPLYDTATGRRITDTTWLYKPPTALDIPADLRVTLLSNAPNEEGVLSSKVTSEPPLCLAFSVVMALRQAISSARAQAGNTDWFSMDCPMTIDNIQGLCLVDQSMLLYSNPSAKP